MTGVKITDLITAVSLDGTEAFEIAQSDTSRQVSLNQIRSYVGTISGLGTMSTQNANAVAITGGTIGGTTSWSANSIGPIYGGTGLSSYAIGDTLYSSASNTLAKLSGNITTSKQFLSQTGTGSASAAPIWSGISNSDISGLGTMSTQNANAVAITGGTINGTTIGATTASTGIFTGLTANSLSMTASPSVVGTFAALDTRFSSYVSTSAAQTLKPEIAGYYGIASSVGSGSVNYFKMALAGVIAGSSGSGDIYAANLVTTGSSGFPATRTMMGLEIDFNNLAQNYSGAVTYPYSCSLYLTGASTFKGQAYIAIDSANTNHYRGIYFGGSAVNDSSIEDNCTATTSYLIAANKTYGVRVTGTMSTSAFEYGTFKVDGSSIVNAPQYNLLGGSSGVISFKAQTSAGTYNFNYPTSAGTSGQPLLSGGGGATAMTFGTLSAGAGGTGQTIYSIGDLLQASASGTLSKLAAVAIGNVLLSGGVGTVSSWGKVDLTAAVTGILPVANGGSGTSTAFTLGSMVFAGASGVYTQDNANLFWDNTNKWLGVGIAVPLGRIHLSGETQANSNYYNVGYAATPTWNMRRANGTAASPTATALNDIVGVVGGSGYFVTGGPAFTSIKSRMYFQAAEAYTSTAQGMNCLIDVTPTGSTTMATVATFTSNGLGIRCTPDSTAQINAQAPDGNACFTFLDSYANSSGIITRRANNTAASPTAVASGDSMGFYGARGYYVTGGPAWSLTTAAMFVKATEAYTSTTQGTKFTFETVTPTTTTRVERLAIDSTGLTVVGGITIPAANVYQIAGNSILYQTGTTYTILQSYAGTGTVQIGNNTDAQIYYNNDGHVFRDKATLTTFAKINSSGTVIGGATINANAVLDVQSTTKAFMPPRMTTTQKNAIASPTAGMVVYDSTLNKLCVRVAAAWETVTSV